MKLFYLVIVLFLSTPLYAEHWLNDNFMCDFYFKWKAIKIKKEWHIYKNDVKFSIESKPNFIDNPVNLIANADNITNINNYTITATITYTF